jgi:16S rRNA U1498 N3-methylase RsmE
MHRFFVSIPLKKELTIPSGDLYHQLTHVFRARIGEKIILFSE